MSIKAYYNYESFQSFIQYLEEHDTYEKTPEYSCASQKIGNKAWSGTENFPEAIDIAKTIWPEGLALTAKYMKEYYEYWNNKYPLQSSGMEKFLDVSGDELDIDSFIRGGSPEIFNSYIRNDQRLIGSSHQTFIICSSYNANIDQDAIIDRGCFILALINLLELRGTRCSIYCFYSSKYMDTEYLMSFPVKKFNDHLDISMVAFATAHPSMLRRLCLRHIEQVPECSGFVVSGSYGHQNEIDANNTEAFLSMFQENENIENSLIIPGIWSNDKTNNRSKILDDLTKVMKRTSVDEIV